MKSRLSNFYFPCREVLECFRREELLDWSWFQTQYGPGLRMGTPDMPPTLVFKEGDEKADKRWGDFRKRVIEHVSVFSNSNQVSLVFKLVEQA